MKSGHTCLTKMYSNYSGTGPALVSPLPFLHSEFPLLSAVANPAKTAVSFIQSSARDILHTISELIAVPVFPLQNEEDPSSRKASSVPESSVKSHIEKLVEDMVEEENNEEAKKEGEDGIEELAEDEDGNMQEGSPSKKSPDGQEDDEDLYDEPKEEMSAVVCDWRYRLMLDEN